jgi:hypothetical protein
MTDSIFAREQSNRAGAVAVERISSDLREGWSPTAEPGVPFRTRTAQIAEFYTSDDVTGRLQLVKYYTVADASGGTYTLYRATASTTTAIGASEVTSISAFSYGTGRVVSKGLTRNDIFDYYQQAAGLPAATAAIPPSSVGVEVVAKAVVGKFSTVTTNTTLVQVRTLYDYIQSN